jgi:hypothetical protein
MTNIVDLRARREARDLLNVDDDRLIEACHQINHSMTIVRDRGFTPEEISAAMRALLALGPSAFAEHCEFVLVKVPMRSDPGTLKALREIVDAEEFGSMNDWEINFAKSMVATKDYNCRLTPKQQNVAYRIVQKVRAGRARDAAS